MNSEQYSHDNMTEYVPLPTGWCGKEYASELLESINTTNSGIHSFRKDAGNSEIKILYILVMKALVFLSVKCLSCILNTGKRLHLEEF